jgi:hypothetical protein
MGHDLPVAEIAHAMPGRARLRIADRRGDAAFFASLAKDVSALPGVDLVDATPLTGSLLIKHSGPLHKVGKAARKAGLFVVGEAPAAPEPGPTLQFDPKLLVALALTGAALWQMSREKFLPPALTLLWYASHLGGVWPHVDPDEGE